MDYSGDLRLIGALWSNIHVPYIPTDPTSPLCLTSHTLPRWHLLSWSMKYLPSYSATISVSHQGLLLTSRVHNSVHAALGLERPHPLQKMQHLWSEHSNVCRKKTSFSWFAVASFQAYYKQSKTGRWEGLGMMLGL